jgi:hypothetical protein
MSAPLLLLDDVGQEVEFGSPVVAHAIQYRYDRVKPILATSGLTVEQLVSRYGAGVGRRLVETAGGRLCSNFEAAATVTGVKNESTKRYHRPRHERGRGDRC